MLMLLSMAIDAIQSCIDGDASYVEAYPESAMVWDKIHTLEIQWYMGYNAGEFAFKPYVHAYEGGFCEYCQRNSHTTQEHKALYPNALYA